MKYLFFVLTILLTNITISQSDLYKPNHFSVTLKDGYNKSIFTPTFGTEKIEATLGHVFQAQFTYIFNIKPKFGIIAQTNVGTGAFAYKINSNGVFVPSGWNRFYRDSYNSFFKLSTGVNYHQQLKPKLILNLNVGGGVSVNGGLHSQISGVNCLDPNCNQFDENFNIEYVYSDNFIGYVLVDLSINYLLKSKNMIGLSLSSEIFAKPSLEGTYRLNNNTSGGTISNNNNNIALGLNYTFTHVKKYEFTKKIKELGELSKKESKQMYKKQKRFVDPNSIFISAGTGMFFGRNIVNDPANVFYTNALASWTVFGNAEVGIKNQYYYEAGIEVSEYWYGIKFSPYGSSGSKAFIATKFNLGISKRFVNKTTNRNYVNVHAGIGVSYQPNKKNMITGNGGGIISADNLSINFTSFNTIKRRVFSSVYVAVEKDLHLTKDLYMSFKYKYDQGVFKVTDTEIKYNTDPNIGYFNVISSKINGTASTFSIGFKYKFLTAKNRIKNLTD